MEGNPKCTDCWLSGNKKRCTMGDGPLNAKLMVVLPYISDHEVWQGVPAGEPGSGSNFLFSIIAALDIDPETEVYTTWAVKCSPDSHETTDKKKHLPESVKGCADYLSAEIEAVQPQAILALGAEAYQYFTHRKGVGKNRGKLLNWEHPTDGNTYKVIPALSPVAVLMEPSRFTPFISDIRKWIKVGYGVNDAPEIDVRFVWDMPAFEKAVDELTEDAEAGKLITFDVETRGFQSERAEYSKMWCCAVTSGRKNEAGDLYVWLFPLEHPDSPWYDYPERVGIPLAKFLLRPDIRTSGHNVKFDVRWMRSSLERWESVG